MTPSLGVGRIGKLTSTLLKGVGWSPLSLGPALRGWWDPDRSDLITQSDGLVSSWRDVVAGYDAAAEGTNKPAYSATAYGGRSGIVFDGVSTFLTLADQPFPSGSDESTIWAVVQNDALPADTSARVAVSYGGNSGATRRDLRRTVVSEVNRGGIFYGTTANSSAVDLSSRHVLRGKFAAQSQIAVDGNTPTNAAAVSGTGTTRFRIGASAADIPGSFWQGPQRDVIITGPLTAEQEAQLSAWLLLRRLV